HLPDLHSFPTRRSSDLTYEHSRWFRGRDTALRRVSRCPDADCCRRPPSGLAGRWEGMAWPSARAHSHILSALPTGIFPGVDETRSEEHTSELQSRENLV